MGFSLIEVLVVVAVVSTLAVAATLTWGRSNTQADITARFGADVSRAQRTAMFMGLDHRLVFKSTGWHAERTGTDGWVILPGWARKAGVVDSPATLLLPADGRTATAVITFETDAGLTKCRTNVARAPTCDGT